MTNARYPGEGLGPIDNASGGPLGWYRLDEMSGADVHALIAFRESIFVVEQRCAYQEADDLDAVAWHLMVFENRALIGCLRLLPPGDASLPTIGRVATRADRRGQGVARRLMREALHLCAAEWPERAVALSAQVAVRRFYESLGFVAEGHSYLEDDIPHIAMQRVAGPAPR